MNRITALVEVANPNTYMTEGLCDLPYQLADAALSMMRAIGAYESNDYWEGILYVRLRISEQAG